MSRESNPSPQMPDDGRSQAERMLEGDWYLAADPQLQEWTMKAQALAHEYGLSTDVGRKDEILNELLGSRGEGAQVRAPFYVDYGFNLHLGARVEINFGLVALDVAPIHIGDDTLIGTNVQLLTPTHPLGAEARRAKLESADPITIGSNIWIGGGAIVLPGVTIGDDSVIGGGTVVTKDVPSRSLVVGNPGRVIREL